MARNSLGIDKSPGDTRVVVAMSGGVDSSVTAALLKEQDYDVVGVTLQLYDHGAAVGRTGACCAGQDIADARAVAGRLDVPHYVLDYESRFRTEVMDAFAGSYLRGETPVPCIACNRTVKFRDLLKTARDLGADALATGHYVQRVMGDGGPELHRGADPARDQSYFLFGTTAEQLDFLRFPLGHMPKTETRALARRFGLPVADKPDSQDICFVPRGRYSAVVARLRPGAAEAGDIVHVDGSVLGRHAGIIHYTVGQRRGLVAGGRAPLYVVRLDARQRRVVVGPRESLHTRWIGLRNVNWLGDRPIPAEGMAVWVRVRSTSEPRPATLSPADGGKVILRDGEYGIATGQACVFYAAAGARSRLLGGGFIDRAVNRGVSEEIAGVGRPPTAPVEACEG